MGCRAPAVTSPGADESVAYGSLGGARSMGYLPADGAGGGPHQSQMQFDESSLRAACFLRQGERVSAAAANTRSGRATATLRLPSSIKSTECVCVCVCVCAFMCVCLSAVTCVVSYMSLSMCMCVHLCVCVCVCVCAIGVSGNWIENASLICVCMCVCYRRDWELD